MTIRVGRLGRLGMRLSVTASACHSNRRNRPNGTPRRLSTACDLPLLQACVWKADPKARMWEMLEPAMFIGLGAVAVWTHVNYPRLRPGSLLRAIVHVVVSFAVFALLPTVLGLLLPLVPLRLALPYFVLALLIPVFTYLLLSWVWLIARILQDIGGNPRGGHPVTGGT